MKKILIYGSDGWIGSKVFTLLENNVDCRIFKSKYRADCIKKEIVENEYEITHVMSFIGRTHGVIDGEIIPTIDYLEKSGKLLENINDNLYSPIILALYCKEHNIHFTYLGTGCIFNYDTIFNEKNGFLEESEPNFFGSSYSIVKGFTDKIMHTLPVLNIRIRMPITNENCDRNFISKILKYSKICSVPNSMTVLDELIPYMIDLTLKNYIGTVNFTNPGVISHNEILTMYKEIVNPNFTWNNFTIEEQDKILLSKRSNNYLDTTLLETLYPNISNIKESVRNIFNNTPDLGKNNDNIF